MTSFDKFDTERNIFLVMLTFFNFLNLNYFNILELSRSIVALKITLFNAFQTLNPSKLKKYNAFRQFLSLRYKLPRQNHESPHESYFIHQLHIFPSHLLSCLVELLFYSSSKIPFNFLVTSVS